MTAEYEVFTLNNGSEPLFFYCSEECQKAGKVAPWIKTPIFGKGTSNQEGLCDRCGCLIPIDPAVGKEVMIPPSKEMVEILKEIFSLRDTMYQNKNYGPFTLKVDKNTRALLDTPYMKSSRGRRVITLRQKLMDLTGISSLDLTDSAGGIELIQSGLL